MLIGDQLQRREQETPPSAPASPPAPTGSSPPGAAKPDASPGDPSKGQFSNATTWLVRIYIDPDPDDVEKTRPILVSPAEKVPWDLDVGQYRIIARAYASTQYGERLVGRSTGRSRSTFAEPDGFSSSVRKISVSAGLLRPPARLGRPTAPGRRGRSLFAIFLSLQFLGACATAGTAPSPSASQGAPASGSSGTGQTPPSGAGSRTTSSGSGRTYTRSAVERSTLMGLMFGSPFGPIGALGGALLGFIYGNLAAGDVEKQSQAEAQRQESLDRDVERQIEARNGEAGAAAGQSRTRSHGRDRREGPLGRRAGPAAGAGHRVIGSAGRRGDAAGRSRRGGRPGR